MALKLTIQEKGVSIKDAYVRVLGFSGNKNSVTAFVSIHASPDDPPFCERHCNFVMDLSGENTIKQAYEHMKTLPEFANAEDV